MARFGINPARGKTSAYQPASITVALLTYIPHLDGYFRNRFEILQLTLASLVANTSLPYDLFIFDNGSISQVVDYLEALQEQGTIRYLFLSSENIGKIGAFELPLTPLLENMSLILMTIYTFTPAGLKHI